MKTQPRTGTKAKRTADSVLDARSWVNSWMVLKAKSVLKEMGPGQVLEVICSDPQAMEILPQTLGGLGCEIINVSRSAETCRIFIRRSVPTGGSVAAGTLKEGETR